MDAPPARYLDRDGAQLAFQVVGDGPADVVILGEAAQHFDLAWTDPHIHELYERGARYSRTAYLQTRGLGLSEPIHYWPTIEQRGDDILAVMDAAGMQRATLVGSLTTCGPVTYVAAKAPERVASLVLFKALPCGPLAEGATQHGWTEESAAAYYAGWREVMARWGSGDTLRMWDPVLNTPFNRRLMALLERCSSTPTFARIYLDIAMNADHTPFLTAIQAPTRVLFAPTAREPREVVHRVAELVPGATFHELTPTPPGASIGEAYVEVWDHIEEAATGTRATSGASRFLGTVVFTDVVASTELLARIGDAAYRDLRAAHERSVRLQVERAGGRLINVTGDGTISVFDGPTKAVRCAADIVAAAVELGIEVRAGVHTGELESTGSNVTGLSVHIGARVSALARPGEVLVSSVVRDLVAGSGLSFLDRGNHQLKGVPGRWRLSALDRIDSRPVLVSGDRSLESPLDRAVLRTARSAPGAMRAALRLGNSMQRRRARSDTARGTR